jgi:tetratricopeptide (TPR) repeat protein
MAASNRLYNEGLEKAQVRDLSGAVISLRQSLKFNKFHIDARNLLGLVCFEMGEVVTALSEWVISKNFRADKNIADDYIEMIQQGSARLDSINQTIKKYNQALYYCGQGSKDLAIIQLKKVLSLNPNFIRAHLLLALLYIDGGVWDRASREVSKCLDIDHNHLMALRYRREIELMFTQEEQQKPSSRNREKKAIRYRSDNEIIIQPMNIKEPKHGGGLTILNIGIGLVIGILATCFLIVPTVVTNARNEAEAEKRIIGNEMDTKTARITQLEAQTQEDTQKISELQAQLTKYLEEYQKVEEIDSLLTAAVTYLSTADAALTDEQLTLANESIDWELAPAVAKQLYDMLYVAIGEELSDILYPQGRELYDSGDYAGALAIFQRAYEHDDQNWDALYYLGHSYRQTGDNANARICYEAFVRALPNTQRAATARRLMNEMTE